MSKKKNKKQPDILRHFQLKFRDPKQRDKFNDFQALMIMRGHDVTAVIYDLISEYFDETVKPHAVRKLVKSLRYEPAMLELMAEEGVSRTRQSLKRMRDRDELEDSNGNKFWGTDGKSIVYDSNEVIKLLKRKDKAKINKRR